MSQLRLFLIAMVLISTFVVGTNLHANNESSSDMLYIARMCGEHPALRQHFRAVIQDGEVNSDWAHTDHMKPICIEFALAAGITLNNALDDEEVPYSREN